MKVTSFKFKLSIIYSLVLGVVLILYSLFLYWGLSTALYDELDKELVIKAKAAVHVLGLYMKAAGNSPRVVDYVFNRISFPEEVDAKLEVVARIDFYWAQQLGKLNMQDDLIQLIGPDGEVVGRSRRLSNDLKKVFASELPVDAGSQDHSADIYYKNQVLRLVSMPCVLDDKTGYVLQIASSQKPLIQLLKNRLYSIIISVPCIFLLMFLAGMALVHQLMKPVLQVTKTADSISHKDLSLRVEMLYGDEEMRQLTGAFNEMIGRLENAFKHIGEFSSQVAHELRTPLTIMKGESELALRKTRDAGEYQRVIKVNLEEIERMLQTVDDLLLLARLEYRRELLKRSPIDLGEFLKEIEVQARVLSEPKRIMVDLNIPSKKVVICGDLHHLRRLFLNLVHNAIKFTPDGGFVSIGMMLRGPKVLVTVEDNGAGIEPEDLPKVFDRFFHKDRGIPGSETGSGLGLSIALTIARGHDGSISVYSQSGRGTIMTVDLPLEVSA